MEDCGGGLLGNSDGSVTGTGVDDDELIGPAALVLYIQEQLPQVVLLV